MYHENKLRSILKTVSYRITSTLLTIVLVYLFSRNAKLAFSIGGIELNLKMLIYLFHERVWNRIRLGKQEVKPAVLWFTGLPGAGKSTIANKVYEKLVEQGFKVEWLDGDNVRYIFPKTGFTKEARNEHIKRVGYLASKLEKNGIFVVASFVSPYQESRAFAQEICRNFVEIYVSTPLEVCEARDPKGLYARARKGEICNFTGIDDPYEVPEKPKLTINTCDVSLEEAASLVIRQALESANNTRQSRKKTINVEKLLSRVPGLVSQVKGG